MNRSESEDQGKLLGEQTQPSGETGLVDKDEYFFFMKITRPEETDPVNKSKAEVGTEINLDESGAFFLTRKECM